METQQIHAKMASILADMDAIGKNARNQQQGFNYRGIDDVYNTINPILAKHGVFMTAQVLAKTREERITEKPDGKRSVLAFTCLRMRYRFYAGDGSFVETEAEGEGMDSGDKSSNKAMAVAHKYALLQAFCIPTKDLDDPDAHSHEVAPQVQPEGITSTPKPDKKAAANKWGNDALAKIPNMTPHEFEVWASDKLNRNGLGVVREYNEALHKRLTEAMLAKQRESIPAAAE